jgi:hypothetical protein
MQARQFIPDQTFAGILRAQRPDLREANDYGVIIRIYRGWWRKTARWDEETKTMVNSDGYARQFEGGCTRDLVAAGMEPANAETWAKYIFLPDRDCREWLSGIRQFVPPAQAKQHQQAIPAFA